MLQERARALSELRRLEADIGEAMRNLKGAQGEEEALRNKAMHLRDEIDRAELARDKALVAHNKAQAVSLSAWAVGLCPRQPNLIDLHAGNHACLAGDYALQARQAAVVQVSVCCSSCDDQQVTSAVVSCRVVP